VAVEERNRMRWLKRKYTKLRLVSLSELLAKPVSPSRFVIEREDGMLWAGPYRFQGASFTNVPHYIYYFANAESAHAAIVGCELDKSGHITSKGAVKVIKVR
jgi:hypothetical protein